MLMFTIYIYNLNIRKSLNFLSVSQEQQDKRKKTSRHTLTHTWITYSYIHPLIHSCTRVGTHTFIHTHTHKGETILVEREKISTSFVKKEVSQVKDMNLLRRDSKRWVPLGTVDPRTRLLRYTTSVKMDKVELRYTSKELRFLN